ncbi:MAG: endonuclease/exonuclease/phosphatase family protein [Gaiella sp.]
MAPSALLRALAGLAALLVLGTGIGLAVSKGDTAPADGPVALEGAAEIRVLTFNIWLGGDQVSIRKVVDAIVETRADIVLLQEAEGQTRRLAELTGLVHASPATHVISRFPLFDVPGESSTMTYAEVRPGRFVALQNLHLTSDPYGPYLVRDGKTLEEVLKNERETRLPELEPSLARFKSVASGGTPVVIGGDFNAPSHLDWTPAAVEARRLRLAVEWPVSVAVENAGFVDAYRAVHPDPVADPGITWTYGYPYPHLEENEVVDRIDQIHVLGDRVEVLAAELVSDGRVPVADIRVTPWPSDHAAVVATLRLVPGRAPALVSVPASVEAGDVLDVRFHADTEDGRLDGGRVAIVHDGRVVLSRGSNNGTDRGSVVPFGTAGLTPSSTYTAELRDKAGTVLASTPFAVFPRGARPRVAVFDAELTPGERIVVRWEAAPADRFDWIGLYAAGDADQENYLAFAYTGATAAGTTTFDKAAIGGALDAGDYEARLMRDDGYVTLATAGFSVRP